MTGVRRTTMAHLPASRRSVVVGVSRVAVVALLPAVVGVLTAAVWRFVVADVVVRVVCRPFAVGTFLTLGGVGAGAVVGVRLMGRPALLSVARALRGGVGGVVPGAVV